MANPNDPASREICKNFDEMAGRLGEIPDETKELVELQRWG